MKNLLLIFILFLSVSAVVYGQQSQGMHYQAIARENDGTLIKNQDMTIMVEMLTDESVEQVVYTEYHHARTNQFGLINLTIGDGEDRQGSFENIPWSMQNIWVRISIKKEKDVDFKIVTASKLQSVPYAYYSVEAGKLSKDNLGDRGGSPANNGDFWSLTGNHFPSYIPMLGTKDRAPLIFITDDIERMRINSLGLIEMNEELKMAENAYFEKDVEVIEDFKVLNGVELNVNGGQTKIFGNTEIFGNTDILGQTRLFGYTEIGGPERNRAHFSGSLTVDGQITAFGGLLVDSDLTVNGITNLNNTLNVNNASTTNLSGPLNVRGISNLYNTFNVNNASVSNLSGVLNVDGISNHNSTFNVNNASVSNLTGVLNVDGISNHNSTFNVNNTSVSNLSGVLNVAGISNHNSTFNVNNASVSNLSGVLNVAGVSNHNSTFNVNNASVSNLSGVLNVTGVSNHNSTFNVNNASVSNLSGVLNVAGISNHNNTFNVNNNSTSNLSGALNVGGLTGLNGQVTINASVGGGDGSYGAYPLRVQGSSQGVAIKLNAGTPNNSNNFITFFNSSNGAVGRIEGETLGEATTTPEFIFDNALLVAEEVKAGVNVGLSFIPVVVGGVVVSSGPCGACIAMAAADLVLATANLIGYNVFALENLGVTYESGSADYAEWLERYDPNEIISAGDIVGVYGGKITKATNNAQQYMVISTKPAMLGNMPMAGEEDLYEKVAFMGQIPVKVRGIVMSGDYILPSGLNDGIGIAVSPDEIKAKQYREIVGVAWSSTYVSEGLSLVNMAIGLNANDVANLAIQQEKRIKELENRLNSFEKRFLALENGTKIYSDEAVAEIESVEVETEPQIPMTRQEMLASYMPAELDDDIMEEAMLYLENTYKKHGIDYKDHPGLNRLFTDAAYQAEVIHKTKEKYKLSYQSLLDASKVNK